MNFSPRIKRRIATTCVAIFPFPNGLAGIVMPCCTATMRSPITANSRPTMTTTIQAGTSSICTRLMNAAEISILSATGSNMIPSVVTCLRRRARYPSSQSVRAATPKIAPPISSQKSARVRSTTTSSGTRKIRLSVRALGKFGSVIVSRGRKPTFQRYLTVSKRRCSVVRESAEVMITHSPGFLPANLVERQNSTPGSLGTANSCSPGLQEKTSTHRRRGRGESLTGSRVILCVLSASAVRFFAARVLHGRA